MLAPALWTHLYWLIHLDIIFLKNIQVINLQFASVTVTHWATNRMRTFVLETLNRLPKKRQPMVTNWARIRDELL